MTSWIVAATVPATDFEPVDVEHTRRELATLEPVIDGGTLNAGTGRRDPWRVTVDVDAPNPYLAAVAGVGAVEMVVGRRALG